MNRHKKKPRGICVIPQCDRESIKGHMCVRCKSWWRYHSLQTGSEYTGYVGRVSLAYDRVGSFRGKTKSKAA